MRISAVAMVVVCLCGMVAILVVPRSVWAVVLPSVLLAQPASGSTQAPRAMVALPTNTAGAVAQTPAATPTPRAVVPPARTPPTPDAPSPTPLTSLPTPTFWVTGETPPPTETPTETPTPTQLAPPTEIPDVSELSTKTPDVSESQAEVPTPTEMPTETPAPTETPTETPVPTETPAPTETPVPTETPTIIPTQSVPQTMYVCGYERCRDEDEYGELIFETEIEVWASSDPNDDRILYTISHDQEVHVVRQERVWEGPGGLWLELESGGWMSDFWLTEERCTLDNLESYSFADCLLGEY